MFKELCLFLCRNDTCLSTSKQRHFVNVNAMSKFYVEATLILGWHCKQLCSYML